MQVVGAGLWVVVVVVCDRYVCVRGGGGVRVVLGGRGHKRRGVLRVGVVTECDMYMGEMWV
jgi:hypothetical protein